MNRIAQMFSSPPVVIGGLLLLGVLEFVALQRSQRATRQDLKALESA